MGGATAVVDLDGVVWLAGQPLEGVGKAVALLRDAGLGVLFATNNSSPSIRDLVTRLARAEIEADPNEVVTAAEAAAAAAEVGSSALVIGEAGLLEAAEARGLVAAELPDSVIVGWQRSFDFETIARAASAVRSGARLIATNDDPTHPTPKRPPARHGCAGGRISTAAEQAPLIAGKPGEQMVALVRERSSEVVVVIGDRPSTRRRLRQAPRGALRPRRVPSHPSRGSHGSDLGGGSLLEVVERFLESAGR